MHPRHVHTTPFQHALQVHIITERAGPRHHHTQGKSHCKHVTYCKGSCKLRKYARAPVSVETWELRRLESRAQDTVINLPSQSARD